MRDDRSALGKYMTVLIVWLIPVALVLIPLLYPTEGYVRDMMVLPVLLILLYVALLLAPLFRPLRNLDFFDDLPEAIDRHVDAKRARKEARELIRLYADGHLPNVDELSDLTPFQRGVKRTLDTLRIDAEWLSGNAEVSRNLVERMETLMHSVDEPPIAVDSSRPRGKKSGRHR
ncbi:MAG: hypothetical protein JXA58_04475 [Dehalococcoidia bacterium]|nr:hypothetical protein [Dehalococcoidia bacterium]